MLCYYNILALIGKYAIWASLKFTVIYFNLIEILFKYTKNPHIPNMNRYMWEYIQIYLIYFVPNSRSPASPRPGSI